MVDVNTTAEVKNRLSGSAPTTPFDHDGVGYQKANCHAVADVTSLLFLTDFAGQAEIGMLVTAI